MVLSLVWSELSLEPLYLGITSIWGHYFLRGQCGPGSMPFGGLVLSGFWKGPCCSGFRDPWTECIRVIFPHP